MWKIIQQERKKEEEKPRESSLQLPLIATADKDSEEKAD